jgi:glycosyltransferase involved in cell wall biosynthesis
MKVRHASSPYVLDNNSFTSDATTLGSVFFDGVLKGDYSLAIVNRYLARSLMRCGFELTLFTPEADWQQDGMLGEMPDIRSRCVTSYPSRGSFDIHLRNTWPPKADDMIGRRLNAYVCFAWEERDLPKSIVDHFNSHLDLVMVTANFVEKSLRSSGINIPVAVVGDGTDHIFDFPSSRQPVQLAKQTRSRVLHVSSCFPRKGADLLVKAFADTFSDRDGVELIIKTFENPHNTIEIDVQKALEAHPRAAPITILKQSMSYPDLIDLMRSSDLFVLPSRGEGFGLPLAEAILLGVPVVTIGYSGQTDFCTEQTAWLADYRVVQSTAHVSSEGAQWAEPDLLSLGTQMRRALAEKAASREKVARGQVLLSAHFKWSDVARRVVQALSQTLAAPSKNAAVVSEPIRIDLVSTWSQVCGIASYSEHLFSTPALASALSHVFSRELKGDEVVAKTTLNATVSRPWGYDAGGIRRLEMLLVQGRSDVIWFQHHPGFFSDKDMTQITKALRGAPYRLSVITLHNVRETIAEDPAAWLSDFDLVIVHTQHDADLLANRSARVSVIPHGILPRLTPVAVDPRYFTVGTFGFLYPHKNVPMLVQAVALARTVDPRMRLKLLNCTRKDPVSWKERVRVEALISVLGLSDAVEADFRFLDDTEVVDRLAQCDVLCFPYGPSTESVTGAARVALAADRPLLCSQSSVLNDVLPVALTLARTNVSTLADALLVISASPNLRCLRDAERKFLVASHNYSEIAERHRDLFAALLRES